MGGNFKDEDKFDAAFKTHVLIDSPESSETEVCSELRYFHERYGSLLFGRRKERLFIDVRSELWSRHQ